MASSLPRILLAQAQVREPLPSLPTLPNAELLFFSNAVARQCPTPRRQGAKPLCDSRIYLSLSGDRQQQLSSSSNGFSPPLTREEAILQARTCLSTTLQKPLNNATLLLSKKVKKQKHPMFRVEIPVVDDSTSSLVQLAYDVFSDLPIRRKGTKPSLLLLWSNTSLAEQAQQAFAGSESLMLNSDLSSVTPGLLNSADLGVFVAPDATLLAQMKGVGDGFYPKPLVLFNPRWGFDEESTFKPGLVSFAGLFEVVYSFMGLEVKGVISRRKGVVFRWVKDGVFSADGWVVLVEDETGKGEMKVVTRFKKRPSIGEVENVLYNLMAANSPVTKSLKFVKDLVSNVTGKKGK